MQWRSGSPATKAKVPLYPLHRKNVASAPKRQLTAFARSENGLVARRIAGEVVHCSYAAIDASAEPTASRRIAAGNS